jgi:topoisomerase-4 subunit A
MLDFQIKKEMFLLAQAQTVLPYLPITEEQKLIQEPPGNDRHALVQEEKKALKSLKVIDEAITLIVSQKGWCQVRHGHGYDLAQFQFKDGDALYASFECHVADYLIAFASNGRVYSLAVNSLLAGCDEQSLSSMMELEAGASLMYFYAGSAEDRLLLATTNGYGFSARVGDMCSSLRIGKRFMNLDEGALPLAPRLISADASALACLSDHLRLLVFDLDEIKPQALGGRGVILQRLEPEEQLLAALPITHEGLTLSTSAGGQEQIVALSGAALATYYDHSGTLGKDLMSQPNPHNSSEFL